jgi:hypothetical protein
MKEYNEWYQATFPPVSGGEVSVYHLSYDLTQMILPAIGIISLGSVNHVEPGTVSWVGDGYIRHGDTRFLVSEKTREELQEEARKTIKEALASLGDAIEVTGEGFQAVWK